MWAQAAAPTDVRPAAARYSIHVIEWLRQMGYTHCFFVAGGNIMHLLDAARTSVTCIPFVHEVAATLAADAFNEVRDEHAGRAFVLVTAGPGLTNTLTGMAQSWLESRELLVIGGQVKSTDLTEGGLRQRGIQEIDGIALAAPISLVAERITHPVDRATFAGWVTRGWRARKGPVFIEICLDAQGAPIEPEPEPSLRLLPPVAASNERTSVRAAAAHAAQWTRHASRPVLLIGGGVSRGTAARMREALRGSGVAVATTWNGMDRVDSDEPNYIGRPNTWGQRSANVLIQQADLLVAVGTRLGLQQTGFNWQAFAPLARVIHVEIDAAELQKGHPRIDLAVNGDADDFLSMYLSADLGNHDAWLAFCRRVRSLLPLNEANHTSPGYVNPYDLTEHVGAMCGPTDIIVPCSSGGAFTVPMQVFPQRLGQRIVTAKGLASMGVGLSCALGAALAFPSERTVLFEGDGGFSQNLQELATLGVNNLNVKLFIMSNGGYASIRMNQKTYFNAEYLGCDRASGLGFPDWPMLFAAYRIPVQTVTPQSLTTGELDARFHAKGPAAFIVHVDPDQTYFPKISSRVNGAGGMESMPLHLMSPDLPADLAADVMPYLNAITLPTR